jgi:nicotinate-nucleotide adenylyltransferase
VVSEKRDLWVPAVLVILGLALLAWNAAATGQGGSVVVGAVALIVALSGALACLPMRIKRGQKATMAFGLGVALVLAPAVPGMIDEPMDVLPWLVAGLALLVPLRRAPVSVRNALMGTALASAVAGTLAMAGVLPRDGMWLLFAGAFHMAVQAESSRPRREPPPPPGPRICVFGGTFDPFHRGHRMLAEAALKCNERLLVVVAASPPHKAAEGGGERTPFHHRVAMARLGVEGLPRTEVLELEGRRPGPSYTVDTLDVIQKSHPPEARFRLLLGADMFQDFPTWHDWEGILERATLLVAARPGFDVEPPPEFEGRNVPIEILEAPAMDVSATSLRRDLAEGRDVGERISPAVRAYVEDHALYARPAGPKATAERGVAHS